MGVDNETAPNYINIVIDDNAKYLNSLRKQAKEDGQEEKKLSISEGHSFNTTEFYFDEKEQEIVYSGEATGTDGKTYVYLSIPLSDILLIDILAYGIKKMAKLKTALESLK